MKEKIKSIIEIDNKSKISMVVNKFLLTLIVMTLVSIILQSYKDIDLKYSTYFYGFEVFSVLIFTVEYFLRIYIADSQYPKSNSIKIRIKYICSPMALVDLLAIIPFYLPLLIPFDLRFLRILRLLRLLRVFKLNRYSSAFDRIWRVITKKQSELVSSIFIMLFVLITSSILMYYAEGEVQPDKFSSIPTSIWWAICTLTTVGYGDVYPVTTIGKLIASIITVLGIGIIALPTAIISSGFLDDMRKSETIKCPNCGKEIKIEEY